MQFNAGRWFKFGALLGTVSALLIFVLSLIIGLAAGSAFVFSVVGVFLGLLLIVVNGVLWTIYGFVYSVALYRLLARMSQFWKIAGIAFLFSLITSLFAGSLAIVGVISGFLGAMVTAWIAQHFFKRDIPL